MTSNVISNLRVSGGMKTEPRASTCSLVLSSKRFKFTLELSIRTKTSRKSALVLEGTPSLTDKGSLYLNSLKKYTLCSLSKA